MESLRSVVAPSRGANSGPERPQATQNDPAVPPEPVAVPGGPHLNIPVPELVHLPNPPQASASSSAHLQYSPIHYSKTLKSNVSL